MTQNKHVARRKIYFLVISLVGVVGTLITLGIIINQLLNKVMISDNEWVHSSNYSYIIEECSRGVFNRETPNPIPLNDETVSQCKKAKQNEIIMSRAIDYKESLIGGISRGFLFFILMLTHLPVFLKTTKEKSPKPKI